MDVVETIVGEHDVLARALDGDQASRSYLSLCIEDLSCQNTRTYLIEGGREVRAFVSPVVRAREPAEVDLLRSNVTVDTVEYTLIPVCVDP